MDQIERKEYQANNTIIMDKIGELKDAINSLKVDIANLPNQFDQRYVSKEAFSPVQKIAYGLVGTILTAVVAGILALVLK